MHTKRIYYCISLNRQQTLVAEARAAQSLERVKAQLSDQDLIPVRIKTGPKIRNRHFDATTLLLITQQLSTLLSTGLPLLYALDLIKQQLSSAAWQVLLNAIIEKIHAGSGFAQALDAYPTLFPPLFRQLIATGEMSGQLTHCLAALAKQQMQTRDVKKRVKKALRYPLFLALVTLAVLLVMLLFVLPELSKTYESFNATLPWFTRLLMQLSAWLQDAAVWLLCAALLLTLLIYYVIYPRYHVAIHVQLLSVPLVGELLTFQSLVLLFQSLAITLQSGIPLLSGLSMTAQLLPSPVYQASLKTIIAQIEQGHTLSEQFKDKRRYPELCHQLIRVGEESGSLLPMVTQLGDYYQQQITDITDRLVQKIEPTMMLLMALIIGSLVIAMYLPIFQLGDAIL